jgi:hypothetical protein
MPSLLIAVPWYLYQFDRPGSAAVGLSVLIKTGHLAVPQSIEQAIRWSVQAATANFSAAILIVSAGCLLLFLLTILVVRQRSTIADPASMTAHACLTAGLAAVPLILAYLGLSMQLRWHLEFMFLPILLVLALNALPMIVRTVAGMACVAVAVLNIGASNVALLTPPAWMMSSSVRFIGPPNSKSVGVREAASDLIRFEQTHPDAQSRNLVFFAVHEHRALHSQALAHYLYWQGSHLRTAVGAFFDLPLDLHNLLEGGFLALQDPFEAPSWNDRELGRYYRWLKSAPAAFWLGLQLVSDINGRYGRFRIVFVPESLATPQLVQAMIASGKEIDGDQYALFWQAQELYWRAKLELIDIITAGREFEMINQRAKAETQANPAYSAKMANMLDRLQKLLMAKR